MSFFEALFFLYLLFPVINEKQFLISNAMKGNITLEKTEELKTKLEKFLNSDEIDFGLYEEPKKNHSEYTAFLCSLWSDFVWRLSRRRY